MNIIPPYSQEASQSDQEEKDGPTPPKKAKRSKARVAAAEEEKDPEVLRIDALQEELEAKFAANSIQKKKIIRRFQPSFWQRTFGSSGPAAILCACIPFARHSPSRSDLNQQ